MTVQIPISSDTQNPFALLIHYFLPLLSDHMDSICKNHFLQQLYRKIDGATLSSKNERNLNCVITFQTHSILQRFMLRFDMLQLDCNDHLFVYDGAHAVGSHKVSPLDALVKYSVIIFLPLGCSFPDGQTGFCVGKFPVELQMTSKFVPFTSQF